VLEFGSSAIIKVRISKKILHPVARLTMRWSPAVWTGAHSAQLYAVAVDEKQSKPVLRLLRLGLGGQRFVMIQRPTGQQLVMKARC